MIFKDIVSLADIKFILIFTFFLYLYFRKKQKAFLTVALAGYLGLFVGIIFDLQNKMKGLVLIIGLVAAVVLSYKELDALEKKGIDAKKFLNPDYIDLIVLITFFLIWTIIQRVS